MRRKIVCLILTIVCFMSGIVVFSGCNKRYDLKTLADVEKYVLENYFDENGNAIMELWGGSEMETVTGFTVTKLKSLKAPSEYSYFLVEFDTNGHIIGKFGEGCLFYSRSSAYKVLGIREEDRYADSPISGKFLPHEVVKIGEYWTAISYYGAYNSYPFDGKIRMDEALIYDEELDTYVHFQDGFISAYNWDKNEKARKKYAGTEVSLEINRGIISLINNSSYYKEYLCSGKYLFNDKVCCDRCNPFAVAANWFDGIKANYEKPEIADSVGFSNKMYFIAKGYSAIMRKIDIPTDGSVYFPELDKEAQMEYLAFAEKAGELFNESVFAKYEPNVAPSRSAIIGANYPFCITYFSTKDESLLENMAGLFGFNSLEEFQESANKLAAVCEKRREREGTDNEGISPIAGYSYTYEKSYWFPFFASEQNPIFGYIIVDKAGKVSVWINYYLALLPKTSTVTNFYCKNIIFKNN